MFVFGGSGALNDLNDIHVFDTETNYWLSTPSGHPRPGIRYDHAAFAYKGKLYIFAGCHEYTSGRKRKLTDMWRFDPETFFWKKVKPKGAGPRLSSFYCCMVGDRVILSSGDLNTPDDLYILDLSPGLKTLCKLAVIQYNLEQSELPHDIRWELAAMTNRHD